MNKVCGFLFSPDFAEVVLMNKPAQSGIGIARGLTYLSGIEGVASKDDRRVRDTMSRLCQEQTGLEIPPEDWTLFAEFLKPDKTDGERIVYFFHNTHRYKDINTFEGVSLCAVPVFLDVTPRLRWLIPLAASWGEQELDCVIMFDKAARGRRKQ